MTKPTIAESIETLERRIESLREGISRRRQADEEVATWMLDAIELYEDRLVTLRAVQRYTDRAANDELDLY